MSSASVAGMAPPARDRDRDKQSEMHRRRRADILGAVNCFQEVTERKRIERQIATLASEAARKEHPRDRAGDREPFYV
jgi:hypothetical protein